MFWKFQYLKAEQNWLEIKYRKRILGQILTKQFGTYHPRLKRPSNWRNGGPHMWHTFLEALGHFQRKSEKKGRIRTYRFFLEAERSSAEARTLEFWNAVLRVSRAWPKMKNTSYGLFWFSNEKSAKASFFWKWRPVKSLNRPIKVAKKQGCHWNF